MVEGVNDYTNNQVTLHTAPGCSMPSSDPTTLGISGSLIGGTDCAAADTANAGCGVRASETNSYGAPFNAMGGGVYASKFSCYIGWHDADRGILQFVALWDDDGIKTWFFPRSSIPSDLSSSAPQPTTWGTPMAAFAASSCDPFKYFYQHTAIFDTTFWYVPREHKIRVSDAHVYSSGDWGGGVWDASGVPGQDQSCAARTGVASCSDFVLNNGASFTEACKCQLPQPCCAQHLMRPLFADWEVKSVKIYQKSS